MQKGFTLIEALISVAIIAIVTGLALPAFSTYIANARIKSASEQLYSDVKYAHSEAIKNQADLYVSFQTGASWCYGIDDAGACDCNAANDCTLNGVEYVLNSSEFQNTTMSLTDLNVDGGISYFTLDGDRGTVDVTGTVSFTTDGRAVTVNVTKMGNPTLCSATIRGYPSC